MEPMLSFFLVILLVFVTFFWLLESTRIMIDIVQTNYIVNGMYVGPKGVSPPHPSPSKIHFSNLNKLQHGPKKDQRH